MAVLIERACTPVFASKMNVDSNSDGVVDGFSSSVDSGITATFSLNNSAQKIEITASANAGNTGVYTGFITVSASTAYSLQVLLRGSITAGAPTLRVYLNWYDASNTFISTSSASDTTITTYWKIIKLENVVSPANATKVVIELDIRAQVAGDTGSVWFRNVMLEQSTVCSTFCTTTRAADSASMNIAPLSDTWSLSGTFALPYDNNSALPDSYIIGLIQDTSRHVSLIVSSSTDRFGIVKSGITRLWTPTLSFNRYTIHKFIMSQDKNGMHLFMRQNNQATIEAHNTNTVLFNITSIKLGGVSYDYYAYPLIESLTLYRNKAITTLAEADAIFDSMNAEMVVNGGFDNGSTGWTLVGGEVIENGMLKKVSTNAAGVTTVGSWQRIKVLPNNTYKIKARLIGYIDINNRPQLEAKTTDCFGAYATQFICLNPDTDDRVFEATITTSPHAYNLDIHALAVGSGTFYYDDISVQLIN